MKRLVVVEKNVRNVLYSSILFFLLLDSRILQSIEPNGEPDGERENKVESTHKNTNTMSRYGFKLESVGGKWEESGLKVDSAVTDVGWGAGGTYISVYTIHEILYCDQRCG